ncbi:MAG TPA: hypothetical protein PLP17_07130, partial [Oligoflexia bacterium]|nr:hypothetical protein [Oligoflexia bacterium]
YRERTESSLKRSAGRTIHFPKSRGHARVRVPIPLHPGFFHVDSLTDSAFELVSSGGTHRSEPT